MIKVCAMKICNTRSFLSVTKIDLYRTDYSQVIASYRRIPINTIYEMSGHVNQTTEPFNKFATDGFTIVSVWIWLVFGFKTPSPVTLISGPIF